MRTAIKIFLILLVIYASFFMILDLIWSLLSQRPNQEQNLLFDYLLPWLVTFGLMITGTLEMFKKRHSKKTILTLLIISGVLEIFTLKWQIVVLIWEVKKGFLSEMIPIPTAILIIIAFLIKLLLNLIEIKCVETENTNI
ncbi:MAG: hypothetical protein ACYC25_11415 [Paludibacter sp.]